MIEMDIDPFINVRAMTKLLKKGLLLRKDIDRYMTNNGRIRAYKTKAQLNYTNIAINLIYFNTSFITEYNDTNNSCSKGK